MKVHVIETGVAGIRPRQLVGQGHGMRRRLGPLTDRRWRTVPIRAWLIEHPEGLILVDTGETARVSEPGYLPRRHPYYRMGVRLHVEPEEELGPRLRALGVSPADIRWVVLTHMHTDHVGGLPHVAGSEIVVTATEYGLARGRAGRARGYLNQHWPAGFDPRLVTLPERPYGPFPRSLELTRAGDVVMVDTAGHTPGHMSVVLEGSPRLFIAGDATYAEELMLRGEIDGISPDDAQAHVTVSRMQRLVAERPTVVLPTHDPGAPARLADASKTTTHSGGPGPPLPGGGRRTRTTNMRAATAAGSDDP